MRISDWSSDVCSSDLDTESLAGSYSERGAGFGFVFAIIAGLAATFTACNCVVFAMLPGLACATENVGSPRRLAIKAIGIRSAERREGKEWCSTCRARW